MSISPEGALADAPATPHRRLGVVRSSVVQALLAALSIVAAYALYFFAVELWESNSVGGALSIAGFVAWIAGIGGLFAGVIAGLAVGVLVRTRANRWTLRRLRWTAAVVTFVVCLFPVIWLFPLLSLTFPLPFIAAAIAAWRTKDLASRVRASAA